MIRRQLLYVRSTSNTGIQILECPLLGVKRTQRTLTLSEVYYPGRAWGAPGPFGGFPTKAVKVSLVEVPQP